MILFFGCNTQLKRHIENLLCTSQMHLKHTLTNNDNMQAYEEQS